MWAVGHIALEPERASCEPSTSLRFRREDRMRRARSRLRAAQTGILAVLSGLLLLAPTACSGTLGDPYGTDEGTAGTGPGVDPESIQVAERLRFPRLSHSQWE